MKRRLSLLVAFAAIAAMTMSLAAVPAGAATPTAGVAVFDGIAKIGDPIEKGESCDAAAGLNFPVTPLDVDLVATLLSILGGGGTEPGNLLGKSKTRCWGFEANPDPTNAHRCIAATINPNVLPVPPVPPADNCNIHADGNLTGFCGQSSGSSGKGEVEVAGTKAYLRNIAWLTSAGSVLPFYGVWSKTDKPNFEKKGIVVGAVSARGTNSAGDPLVTACSTANGADTFQVTGFSALLNTNGIT